MADGILSNFLISSGYAYEWNPFLLSLIATDGFLLLKVLAAIISMFLLWDIYKRQPTFGAISSVLIVTIYTSIVYWNIGTFFLSTA